MGHTILLADDSVTIRRIVELAFRDTDIRVDSVGSGREALDRFRSARPDVVLADVVMPPPSGYDVCRAVKSSDPAVRVLLLRGSFEPFDEQRATAAGADGHVSKPFEADRLVERVRELIRAGGSTAAAAPRGAGAPLPAGPPPDAAQEEVEEALDDLADDGGAPPAAVEVTQPIPVEVRQAAIRPVRVVRAGGANEPDPAPPRLPAAPDPDERLVEAVARRVIERLSERVVREIAWDVVPDLATAMIRERLREIEGEDRDPS